MSGDSRTEQWKRVKPDTDELVALARAGDQGAFAALYKHYFPSVFAYLRVAVADENEAEDLAQEVFVRALEALPGYESRGRPFAAWLFRIARNLAMNSHKRSGRTLAEDPAVLDRLSDGAQEAVDESVMRRLSDGDLMLFVGRMPLPQQQVIVLRYVMDMDIAEVAKTLGRSPDAVRQIQRRAFKFLRARFIALGRAPKSAGKREPSLALPRKAAVVRMRKFSLLQ